MWRFVKGVCVKFSRMRISTVGWKQKSIRVGRWELRNERDMDTSTTVLALNWLIFKNKWNATSFL